MNRVKSSYGRKARLGCQKEPLDSLMSSADRFDFAVLVLSADDLLVSRGEVQASPRDNVLFELGLFIGRLGRDRTFIVNDRNAPPKLPTDLAGITTVTFQLHESGNLQAALGATCTKIEQAIARLGTRAESRLGRLSKAAAQFQDVSEDAQQLLGLLARSRAVELDIISEQFGALIDPAKLSLIRRDLADLERRLARRQVENLSQAEQEILLGALPLGTIYTVVGSSLVSKFVRVANQTFGDQGDPQSLAVYWRALEHLVQLGLVDHVKDQLYRLTAEGFTSAKRLEIDNKLA